MKTALALLVICLSSVTFAQSALEPVVGDSVEYQRTWRHSDGRKEVQSVVQSLASFDSATRIYTISICQDKFCQSVQASEAMVVDSIYSTVRIRDCIKAGGDIQLIQTTAGSFKTCHGYVMSTEVWDANIPFGMVKNIMHIEDDSTVTDELIKIEKF